ncbi:hypothetical protein DPEC_G00304680 [Dallia pectoralis]|uniref:Uncharacterized protein n=1 Tax=Dallia pectoralis TaxID=75939 RepID=A0ACC2FDP1_DALPE|nr:hypothetical protein DPEC_G00304680 [Dallia pectoralis]
MWYVGNIHVLEESFGKSLLKKKDTFVQLARKFSERLSRKLPPGDASIKYAGEDGDKVRTHAPGHTASRITWGKSVVIRDGLLTYSL